MKTQDIKQKGKILALTPHAWVEIILNPGHWFAIEPQNRNLNTHIGVGYLPLCSDYLGGEVSSCSFAQIYQAAEIFLYTSLYEGFGMPILEALSSGVPVITSNIPPFHETVKQGVTGFICNSKKEYIKAIKELPSIQPTACRERVIQYFTKEIMANGYLKLYHKAIEKNNW